MRAAIAVCAALALGPGAAAAEPDRGFHWGVGAGGFLAVTGSERSGSLVEAEVYPGGALGRLGLRLEARGLGRAVPDAAAAGVIYEGAAARPRLQIALYAAAGATFSGDPTIAAGAQTQLWIAGPLAIGLDGGAWLRIAGDAELVLFTGLTLRLAR